MEQRTTLDKVLRFIRRYNRYIKVILISLIALIIAMLPTEAFGIEGRNAIHLLKWTVARTHARCQY